VLVVAKFVDGKVQIYFEAKASFDDLSITLIYYIPVLLMRIR